MTSHRSLHLALALLLSTLLPTTSAQTSNSDFNSEYNSTKKAVTGTQIAIIVVCVVLGVAGLASAAIFCCVLSRNRDRRARQAREIQTANQTAAERRAREGGGHLYAAAPQQEEAGVLHPYQYGPAWSGAPREMDAVQNPVEADSRERAKAEMP
ncbi:Autophagy-related protein 1010 [Neofusicoccum parvum]|uniref:Autophagy-related protein 1010 n=1 Tax=Neofusicoccum parvum TaxID=310453 RepID=A0ACB5S8A3_9PEZI|nr:Autophagy-related protein 1010 [Neofusicoccum parvum]